MEKYAISQGFKQRPLHASASKHQFMTIYLILFTHHTGGTRNSHGYGFIPIEYRLAQATDSDTPAIG